MGTRNVIFIDDRVSSYETLLTSLHSDSAWFLLNRQEDGIEQMQRILADYSLLDSIHIIGHGSSGTLFLGNVILNSENLAGHEEHLQSIGASLSELGDILLYGSNVAQGNGGIDFIYLLSEITGADVAASTDSSGAQELGGDSKLESETGSIEGVTLNLESLKGLLTGNSPPTFTVGEGVLSTQIGAHDDVGYSVMVQADGKIVVAGYSDANSYLSNADFAIVRYNTDGSLDTSFDGDGKVTTNLGGSEQASSIAIQSDGKILLAGYSSNGKDYDFALAQYNSDGSLDISFNGDGKVTTNLGGSEQASSIAIQSDGKILIAGRAGNPDFALLRYNSDGTLDSTFDSDGIVITPVSSAWDVANDLFLQNDGKILVAGYASTGYNSYSADFALLRYNTDGSPDTTFGIGGKVTTAIGQYGDTARAIDLQPDGKILVAGASSGNFVLVRFNSNGSLDTTFDIDGKVVTNVGVNSDGAYSLAIQPNGKILLAGYATGDFVVVRYNSDGSLDDDFGSDGKVVTNFGSWGKYDTQTADLAYSLTLQPDGKILVAGKSYNGFNYDFALARYNSNGSLDQTFNPASTLDERPTYTENGAPIILDSNVEIRDQELDISGSYAGATLSLMRHGGSSLDDVFSSSGELSPLIEGSALVIDSTLIGTVIKNSSGELTLIFNKNSTGSLVNKTLNLLSYSNTSDSPPLSVQIDWIFSDGNAGAQEAGDALTVTGSTIVDISSVNDAPEVSFLENVTYTDTSKDDVFLPASGTLIAKDPDSDVLSYGIVGGTVSDGYVIKNGQYGVLRIDIATGEYIFTPNDSVIEDLKSNSIESFTFTVSDGIATVNRNYSIELIGANDPTYISGEKNGNVNVDVNNISAGQLVIEDRDLVDLPFIEQKDVHGLYGTFSINASGSWTYILNNSLETIQSLPLGSSLTDSFTVTSSGSIDEQVIVNIHGTENQAPVFARNYGAVTTSFEVFSDKAYSLFVQSDGKILLAGSSLQYGSGHDFALARYNTDGTPDTTFSEDGRVTTAFNGGNDRAYSITVQPDGRIILLGAGNESLDSGRDQFALVRYNTDGSLDTTFGGDGKVSHAIGQGDRAYSAFVQDDGKILVAGIVDSNFALVRYHDDGSLDTAYGYDGRVLTQLGYSSYVYSVSWQTDGKILVAHSPSGDFSLHRFNPDGSSDTTFNSDGVVTTDLGSNNDYAYDVTVQVDGKILVAGESGDDFALVRYNKDGSLDTTFSDDGLVTTPIGSYKDKAFSVTVQDDGKILLAGSAFDDSAAGSNQFADFALVRYNSDGSLDTTFSYDGKVTTHIGFADDVGYDVTVQADGKILVAGHSSDPLIGQTYDYADFAVIRYNNDGSLDSTFGAFSSLDYSPANFVENGVGVALAGSINIYDPDLVALGNYAGASLLIARQGGSHPDDLFSGAGIVAGQVAGDIKVTYDTVIGTYQYSRGSLLIEFNSDATQELVDRTLRNIHYQNSSDNPPKSVKVDWIFSDGNIGGQGSGFAKTITGSTTVSITSVNDLPSGADKFIDMSVRTTHVLSVDDFGFNDVEDGTNLTSVIFDTIPLKGKLFYEGAWIATAGIAFSRDDLQSGSLVYESDSRSTVLKFRVMDAEGGVATSSNSIVFRINTAPTGYISLEGTARQGEVLTASNSLADLDGLGTISYQWQADGSDISGATDSTYTLTQADVGKSITVQASYTDGYGNLESVLSESTDPVGYALQNGSFSDDTLQGAPGFNHLVGGAGHDHLSAHADSILTVLEGGQGNDMLIGGNLADMAVFSGNRADYDLDFLTNELTVTDTRSSSPDGTDTLSNLNLVKFADVVEFLPMASDRVALTGDETDNTIAVNASKLYNGTRLEEIFVVSDDVSSMIMAGDGDKIIFQGSFADYDFAQLGSQLQFAKDGYINTVNIGGDVLFQTEEGTTEARLLFDNGLPIMTLGEQVIGEGFDVAGILFV